MKKTIKILLVILSTILVGLVSVLIYINLSETKNNNEGNLTDSNQIINQNPDEVTDNAVVEEKNPIFDDSIIDENDDIGVPSKFIEEKIKNRQNFILYLEYKGHEDFRMINEVIIPFAKKLTDIPVVIYVYDRENPSNQFERDLETNHGRGARMIYYKGGIFAMQIDRFANYEGLKPLEVIDDLEKNVQRIYE